LKSNDASKDKRHNAIKMIISSQNLSTLPEAALIFCEEAGCPAAEQSAQTTRGQASQLHE
jgi:hypothetical protein